MRIGYAALTKGVFIKQYKSYRLKDLEESEEKVVKIMAYNLKILEETIKYNIDKDINFFRISSSVIPLASHEKMKIDWQEIFKDKLKEIGCLIKSNKMRVSMHPGQYTILNSSNPQVVKNSVRDLSYHNNFLTSLGLDRKSKIILHIGGIYGNKESAINNFIKNYESLDLEIKNRLIIENDDKSFNIQDIFNISEKTGAPIVYDAFHNYILPSMDLSDREIIERVMRTWSSWDGPAKIHYSQQDLGNIPGSHSPTIDLVEFLKFYDQIEDLDNLDLMLEVKDKNLSAIKIKNLLENREIKYLEREWAQYKYKILEKSPDSYNKIRKLLKDKKDYPIIDFYKEIDKALAEKDNKGYQVNALDHVWGYFSQQASEKEKQKYNRYKDLFLQYRYSIGPVKNYLYKLAVKYEEDYLLSSYFFYF